MDKYLDEFIEIKAKLEAIKAYVETETYFSRAAIKKILGLKPTEEDD